MPPEVCFWKRQKVSTSCHLIQAEHYSSLNFPLKKIAYYRINNLIHPKYCGRLSLKIWSLFSLRLQSYNAATFKVCVSLAQMKYDVSMQVYSTVPSSLQRQWKKDSLSCLMKGGLNGLLSRLTKIIQFHILCIVVFILPLNSLSIWNMGKLRTVSCSVYDRVAESSVQIEYLDKW